MKGDNNEYILYDLIYIHFYNNNNNNKTLETKSSSSKRGDFRAIEISHILTAAMVTQIYLSIPNLKWIYFIIYKTYLNKFDYKRFWEFGARIVEGQATTQS